MAMKINTVMACAVALSITQAARAAEPVDASRTEVNEFAQTGPADTAAPAEAVVPAETTPAGVAPGEAVASPEEAPGAATAAPDTIDEVVVTAQKRAESVMDVPISIAAFSSEALERSNIANTDDLQTVVPGIEFRRQISALTPFIRGIGSQNSAVGIEGSVAIYVDGIYQSLPVANAVGFSNLERIEVLKGPQGTLFGRNATGGAVNIITRDPSQNTGGTFKVGTGNYDTSTAEFYGTTGITDHLATNLSAEWSNQGEGYDHNNTYGKDVNKARSLNLRNKWLWTNDDTEARFTASYAKSTGAPGVQRAISPGTTNVTGSPAQPDYHETSSDYIAGEDTGHSRFNGKDAALESGAATLRLDHNFGAFKVVSISGYLDQESFYIVDQDDGPVPLVDVSMTYKNKQVSQEFQILSNTEGPFSWIAGAYFMDAKHQYDPLRLRGLAFAPLDHIDIRDQVETTSLAAFAEAGYEFTEATKLTLGVRYTDDEKKLTGETNFVQPDGTTTSAPFEQDPSWKEPTWRAVLDHKLGKDMLAYASYSRGFKSGSINAIVTSGVTEKPVDPEHLDAYELGLKGKFLDNTLAVTAATFYYDFKNMQVSQAVTGGTVQSNAASAKIYGGEMTAQYIVGHGFQVRGGMAYTHAEFASFPNGPTTVPYPVAADSPDYDACGGDQAPPGGNCLLKSDLKNNQLPRTPKFTGDAAVSYSTATTYGVLDANVTYYYNGGFYWEVDNRLKQDAYGLLGAQLTWTEPNDRYGATIWGKNLTDTNYAVFGVSEATDDSYAAGAPRTYGITLFANF